MPWQNKTENDQSQRPLRVLFVMGALEGGGAEKMALELLRRFDRRRIQPSLFLFWRRGVYLKDVPSDVSVSWGLEDGELARHHVPKFLARLLPAVRGSDVIVGGVELVPSYFAWLGAALLRKPVVGWVHTELRSFISHQPGWVRMAAKMIYPQFDSVVVLTPAALQSLRDVAAISPKRLHVIPNFIDADEIRELAAEPLPPWAQELTAKPFVVGIGRLLNREKGFDLLVKAHALVRRWGIDCNLVILGEGPDRRQLQQVAEEVGVKDSVFMPGFQANPFPVLKLATALAVPSRIEGFGLALVEAMSLGIPAIACKSADGPFLILEGGKFGMLVNSESVEELAIAMRQMITCPALRQDYSGLAAEGSKVYEIGDSIKKWETLLRGPLEEGVSV